MNKATFLDLRKIQLLNRTLVRFDIKLKVVCEERRKQLFDWLQKWTPNNEK